MIMSSAPYQIAHVILKSAAKARAEGELEQAEQDEKTKFLQRMTRGENDPED